MFPIHYAFQTDPSIIRKSSFLGIKIPPQSLLQHVHFYSADKEKRTYFNGTEEVVSNQLIQQFLHPVRKEGSFANFVNFEGSYLK